MSSNPTVAKIGESGLVFAKDKTTNQVTTIATTADMQIGLPNQSADLSLTGALGLSTLDITIAASSSRSIPDSLTNINVTTTGASGTATLRLPAAPKKGQLVYIKDAGGYAGTVSITVIGSLEGTKTNRGTFPHLIDGSSSRTITTNYGALQLLWNGSAWSIISNDSAPIDASYVVVGSNTALTNERVLTAGAGITITNGGGTVTIEATGAGAPGDVLGPASATDNAVARFDLTTGKLIQNSGVTISDGDNITTPGDLAINGGDITSTASSFNLLNSTVTTLNVGGAATSITAGSSTATVTMGQSVLGAWPSSTTYAYFAHKDATSATGYALLQASPAGTKNTWINAPSGGRVYIGNNDTEVGYLDNNEVSLTGQSGVATTTTLGNTTGASSVTINAGTGNIDIGTSNSARTINIGSDPTGTATSMQTINIGAKNTAGFNMLHLIDEDSSNGHEIYILSDNGTQASGTSVVEIGTVAAATTIDIGKSTVGVKDVTIGGTGGASSLILQAGLSGITLSGSSTTTITGSTSTSAEAHIGTAELGELPYTRTSFPSYFAMFGHKTLDHSLNGNYALVQSYDGDTFLNAASTKSIYLQNAGNLIGTLDNSNITLTGQANTSVATTLGSSYGLSSTNIYGGLFGITLSGSGATSIITGSASGQADVYIGSAEIGVHPFWGRNYAMFSHKDMDNSVDGNAALIQAYDGDTFLGAKSTKSIFIKNGTTFIGKFDNDNIELTGDPSTSTATVIGNSYGLSSTNIYGGLFGITLSGSGASTIITGSALGNADAYIGSAEIGVHPFWGRNYAMFGHKDLSNASDGNAALIQSNVGDTFLGAVDNNYLYFKNGIRTLGYFQYSTFFAKSIFSLSGADGSPTSVTIGNSESSSNLTLNAGSGSIDIGTSPQSRSTNIATGAAVQTVTLGSSNSSSTLTLDAGSGGINIGTNPGGSSKTINIGTTAGINTDSNIGSEYLASKTVIKAGGPFASLGGLYLSGSTVTTYTIGGETGTGTISLGRSTESNTINIGASGNNISNTQTINVGNGTGRSIVAIGSQSGISSLTLDSGTGNIDIGTSTASGRIINVGTGTSNQYINIGNNSTANQVVIYGGAPFVGVGGIYLTGSAGTTYTIGGETGTGTISLGRSTTSNTINIGGGTTTTGNTQTVNIASSASGTGLAAITIGNTNGASSLTLSAGTGVIDIGTSNNARTTSICTGAASQTINIGTGAAAHTIAIGSTTGASSLALNAGTGLTTIDSHTAIARTALVAYPSDTVTDYPMQLKVVTGGNTIRWAIGADTGSDLNFSYSLNSTTVASKGYLANTVDVAAIDFTGQHRNYPVGGNVLDFSDKIGLIVASVGRYKSLTSSSAEISINEALPMVELSTKRNQKSVFGVISDHEDPNETSREYVIGNWGSVYEKMQNDDRLIINSLGEGAIWICNVNGNLQNGDYITSCEVPGYGMKQDDDVLHNYTVAKITCDCDFSLDSTVYRCEEFRHEGKTYRRAFVGCTYHCG